MWLCKRRGVHNYYRAQGGEGLYEEQRVVTQTEQKPFFVSCPFSWQIFFINWWVLAALCARALLASVFFRLLPSKTRHCAPLPFTNISPAPPFMIYWEKLRKILVWGKTYELKRTESLAYSFANFQEIFFKWACLLLENLRTCVTLTPSFVLGRYVYAF
jgi:hypothetical protein